MADVEKIRLLWKEKFMGFVHAAGIETVQRRMLRRMVFSPTEVGAALAVGSVVQLGEKDGPSYKVSRIDGEQIWLDRVFREPSLRS